MMEKAPPASTVAQAPKAPPRELPKQHDNSMPTPFITATTPTVQGRSTCPPTPRAAPTAKLSREETTGSATKVHTALLAAGAGASEGDAFATSNGCLVSVSTRHGCVSGAGESSALSAVPRDSVARKTTCRTTAETHLHLFFVEAMGGSCLNGLSQ